MNVLRDLRNMFRRTTRPTLRRELRELLDTYPGAAQRIVRAIEAGAVGNSFYSCFYAIVTGSADVAQARARRQRLEIRFNPNVMTPLENAACTFSGQRFVREECIVWLAEHGIAKEPTAVFDDIPRG